MDWMEINLIHTVPSYPYFETALQYMREEMSFTSFMNGTGSCISSVSSQLTSVFQERIQVWS